MVGALLLLSTWRRFPLTALLCWLLAIHSLILILGGHYTYADVPLGNWLEDLLDLDRNPYDRIGHFAQGFAPAILTREILLRTSPLRRGKWLFFLVTCACLAFSAFYELVEWWAAIGSGDGSPEFLGTQGDVWDAQWDMFTALVGAISAQVLLARVHDRQLEALQRADSA
jgi:putative membrane protein